jgi:CRISPR type III-B/RAMP module-associated protein Cmr5
MLLKSGIGQTLAVLLSKAKGDRASSHGLLVTHLGSWVGDRCFSDWRDSPELDQLLTRLINSERGEWHRATSEAVAFATWLKRFAEALMPAAGGHEEDDSEQDDAVEPEEAADHERADT